MILKQVKWLSHHKRHVKAKLRRFAFSHQYDWNLILSRKCCNDAYFWRNTQAFLPHQITHTQESQTRLKTKQVLFGKPPKVPNWRKWSDTCSWCTVMKPNRLEIPCQSFPKKSQERNRWSISSVMPHPPIQNWTLDWRMCLLIKLSAVAKWLRSKRQTKYWP